ncbi:MAG TPA: dihydrodipicolinate synthase family protein [Burkholderiales bacterium]|nr:dihydrodipicolinate synthase family protein [Burkholderiales bacterium]
MTKNFKPGLVHTPITPFKRDQSVDYDTYAKVLEFHIKHGAEALALPMPEGEDMSLTDPELRKVLEFAIKQVKGRVPVIAHVSDAGTAIAVERAVHAEKAGAAAIVTHPPYFWHPKPAMIVEHIARIGAAVKLPLFIFNPPIESVGATLSSGMVLELVERVPNLVGIVDAGLEFVFMEEIMGSTRAKHPEFQLLAGQDYPVSAFALGGSGVFSPLSAIAPGLVKNAYNLCKARKFIEARGAQENLAELHHLLKEAGESGLKDGLAGIKTAMASMGRECGAPRPPVRPLGEVERGRIAEALRAMPFLAAEPRGW